MHEGACNTHLAHHGEADQADLADADLGAGAVVHVACRIERGTCRIRQNAQVRMQIAGQVGVQPWR